MQCQVDFYLLEGRCRYMIVNGDSKESDQMIFTMGNNGQQ